MKSEVTIGLLSIIYHSPITDLIHSPFCLATERAPFSIPLRSDSNPLAFWFYVSSVLKRLFQPFWLFHSCFSFHIKRKEKKVNKINSLTYCFRRRCCLKERSSTHDGQRAFRGIYTNIKRFIYPFCPLPFFVFFFLACTLIALLHG